LPARIDLNPTLSAYDWQLTAAHDARGQNLSGWQLPNRPPLRLQFRDGRLAVQNLCNAFSASVKATGEHVEVSQGIMTKRLCNAPGLMELEQRVATQLPLAQRLELHAANSAAPQLTLHFSDGAHWQLAGLPTPATRHGSPGERVFLEVAPDTVPCNNLPTPCLRVRELRYDEQGLRQGAGEWRVLQGGIEGFQQEPGFRKVLRLQRFPGPPNPVYVLDMVVESELVR
jgi:heat shock protein HslJ